MNKFETLVGSAALATITLCQLIDVKAAEPLLQKADLAYQGAFRLPSGTFGGSSFAFGGQGLAYNSANNSLFITGHVYDQMTAEITVPRITNSNQINDLATAVVLQNFTDVTEGRLDSINPGDPNSKIIGGYLVYNGNLIVTGFAYYDANGTQIVSHFTSSTNLSTKGDVSGPYQVGTLGAGFVSGYLAQIPSEWQDSLGGPALTGNAALSIISRTSWGPAAFVFDPADFTHTNPVPDIPLVYYNADHPTLGVYTTNAPFYFNGTTQIKGIVFPKGCRSVLFFGRQGKGAFCYGIGGASGGDCNDPADDSKGTHGYPYAYQVWAYDVQDFISVKKGLKQPWEITPYSIWNFALPFEVDGEEINGAAYDPATQRVFLSQAHGDGDNPLIQVFAVDLSIASVSRASSPNVANTVKIFPNPARSVVSIIADGMTRAALYDRTGRLIAEFGAPLGGGRCFAWNGSSQPSGIYIVKIIANGRTIVRQITLVK
jgi:hypothetical protein